MLILAMFGWAILACILIYHGYCLHQLFKERKLFYQVFKAREKPSFYFNPEKICQDNEEK